MPPTSAARPPMSESGRTLRVLIAAMVLTICTTAGLTAAAIVMTHRLEWWSAWAAALGIGFVAAIVSLAPVVPGVMFGAQWAAYGYLAGSTVRCLSAVLGCVAAVVVLRTPALPTVLLTAPLYFAQVAVEAIVLARAFWPRG